MNGARPFRLPELEMPNFQDVSFTSRDVVEAATWLVGLPYSEKTTYVEWDEKGQPHGYCNCWGLLLVVCERLGLIGPEFWTWLHFSIARRGVAQALRRVLGHLMVRVENDDARRGDVLLFRWTGDFREWQTEEEAVQGAFHHIGFLTSHNLSFLGAMVHAVDTKADLSGHVLHSPIAPHDLSQLHSVWRFPQLMKEVTEAQSNG